MKNIVVEVNQAQPKFAVGDIVTDHWTDIVGVVDGCRWSSALQGYMYTLRSVPPYPWPSTLHISAPKAATETSLQLFDKPADFDEAVRQETLHPMLRGWGKDVG